MIGYFGDGLPATTVTIYPAVDTVCGVGHDHPADEVYEFGDRGGPIRRCVKHGGQDLRDRMRARGHTIIDYAPPPTEDRPGDIPTSPG